MHRGWTIGIVVLVTLGGLGIVGVVQPNDQDEASTIPGEQTRHPKEARGTTNLPKPVIGSVGTSGSGASLSSRKSLEHRLRLFGRSQTLGRASIVHSIRGELPRFRRDLLQILEERHGDLILPAIQVSGRLSIADAVGVLIGLLQVDDPEIRKAAIRSLSDLKYWDAVTIRHNLDTESDAACIVEYLRACALIKSPPIASILPLLSHDAVRVVRAAEGAMPTKLSEGDLVKIALFVQRSKPGPAIAAVRVVSRLKPGNDRDQLLVDLLASKDWNVRQACLTVLCTDGKAVRDATGILNVIAGTRTGIPTKVRAYRAIEKTRAFDERLSEIEEAHPVARLALARCLVAKGDRAGLQMLIELLDTKEGPDVDDEDRECAIEGAREILCEVSRRDWDTDKETWLRWCGDIESLEPREIKAPVRLNW